MGVGKRLDSATLCGLALGIGSLLASMILEFYGLNPDLGTPFLKLSALLIIFGGTFGCGITSFNMEEVLNLPTLLRIAFSQRRSDPVAFVRMMVKLAELARREGILALDTRRADLEENYPFLWRGFQYVIDGRTPDVTKNALVDEVFAMEERHKVGANLFTALGGYAPTMGIVGTVLGLISALGKAAEGGGGTSAVVGAIATAFIATFYGIASANLFFLPIAGKLQQRNAEEVFFKMVQIEGILAIQTGENPRLIGESLQLFFRETKPSTTK